MKNGGKEDYKFSFSFGQLDLTFQQTHVEKSAL